MKQGSKGRELKRPEGIAPDSTAAVHGNFAREALFRCGITGSGRGASQALRGEKNKERLGMKKNQRGFSLIELLIVVAIILIIAAIAIPDLLKSKQAANQASAVGSLHTINTSEVSYASTYTTGYSSTLTQLDGTVSPSNASSAGLIDSVLAAGVKSMYTFSYTPTNISASPTRIEGYQITGSPVAGTGNGNFYYTDNSFVIRQNNSTTAGSTDSPMSN
jgi:type IV pilus assembly protein PilA